VAKPNTGLGNAYPLTTDEINEQVDADRIGVYVLGDIKDKTFYVDYVGRSDNDVNGRLRDYVSGAHSHFKFGYCATKKAAFEKECTIWHDFPELQKKQVHPDRPNGSDDPCPVADCDTLD